MAAVTSTVQMSCPLRGTTETFITPARKARRGSRSCLMRRSILSFILPHWSNQAQFIPQVLYIHSAWWYCSIKNAIVRWWKEYFEDPSDMAWVEEAEAEDWELDSSITQVKVTEVFRKLLGGKALGVDKICPKYLKSLEVVGLTGLCSICWQSGTEPLDWATRVVVPLFKPGDQRV